MRKFINYILILSLSFAFVSVQGCYDDDDECQPSTWFADADGDGFGDPLVTQSSCSQPANFVANNDDVDDTDASLNPNSVWQGASLTFVKADNADWTLAENQDRITDNVWITRADNQGIFNIASEMSYSSFSSPADTEWAFGTTANISALNFQNWEDTHDSSPPSTVDANMVLHLITDDIYMDIRFTSWSQGGSGGGFSYVRSTPNQ